MITENGGDACIEWRAINFQYRPKETDRELGTPRWKANTL